MTLRLPQEAKRRNRQLLGLLAHDEVDQHRQRRQRHARQE